MSVLVSDTLSDSQANVQSESQACTVFAAILFHAKPLFVMHFDLPKRHMYAH